MAFIGTFDSMAEAAKLTQSRLLSGIVQEVYNIGQIWPRFPVEQVDSYSVSYNREVLASEGHFVAIGDDIPSDADVAYTQVEVFLKRYIKQWDLDHFIRKTWRNINDPEAQAIAAMTKGLVEGLEGQIIYAAGTGNTFTGLHGLVQSAQTIHQGSGSTGAALSFHNLMRLIDLVRPRPDFILLNRNIWRRLSEIALGGTTSFPLVWMTTDMQGMGKRALYFDGVELIPTDYITQTETIASAAYSAKTGGATTTIFAGRFGSLISGGICMLMGNPLMEPVKIPNLENKDAGRYRLITYAAPALGSTKALAAIDGVTDVALVA